MSHKNDWSTENPKPSSERGLLSQTSQCGPRNMHRRRFPQLHAQYVRAVHANKPTNQPTTSSHPINHMGSVSHPANKSRQRSRSHGENSFDCRWPFPRRRKANDEQTTNDERRTTNDERRTTQIGSHRVSQFYSHGRLLHCLSVLGLQHLRYLLLPQSAAYYVIVVHLLWCSVILP